MIPFEENYYRDKIYGFKNKCIIKSDFYLNSVKLEYEYKYEYENNNYECIKLIINNKTAMIVSPIEVYQCYEAEKEAKGIVCVVGLGLGYFVQQIIDKNEVEKIIVFEINKDVIELYKMNFKENKKVTIINEDIFKYVAKEKMEEIDFLFCDIYTYEVTEKNIRDYKYLSKNFNIKRYTFFGVERLIINIKKYNLSTNKLPKFWIYIGEDIEQRLSKSNKHIKAIQYNEIMKILQNI